MRISRNPITFRERWIMFLMKELIYCKLNFFLTFSFHAKNKSFYNQKRGDQAVPTIVSDMVNIGYFINNSKLFCKKVCNTFWNFHYLHKIILSWVFSFLYTVISSFKGNSFSNIFVREEMYKKLLVWDFLFF